MTSLSLRHKNLIRSLLLVLLSLTALPFRAAHADMKVPATLQSERPVVEAMFVLDTTGSMGGLIAAAKEKIWSIANTLASADPAPEIRMGLVGYRDRGDAYVTSFTPLSDDLDAVYTRLMDFQADGGGDTPESVNQALHEALTKTDWSNDPKAYRVIFLVGDAPPHMNYARDVPYLKSCGLARERGIIINTIQCGNLAETTPIWQAIARQAEGQFFGVAQTGSAVLYETPFDHDIADLSKALDKTRIFYGDAQQIEKMEARAKRSDTIYEAAATSAVARRTIFNSRKAGATNFLGTQELIHDVATGHVNLEHLDKEQLPAELKDLDASQLKARIAAQTERRKTIQAKIDNLAHLRQAYIEKKVRQQKDKGAGSLDVQIYKCIQTQAAAKQIQYTDGPAY